MSCSSRTVSSSTGRGFGFGAARKPAGMDDFRGCMVRWCKQGARCKVQGERCRVRCRLLSRMPRILPRLLQKITSQSLNATEKTKAAVKPVRRSTASRKRRPQLPPSFSPFDRKHSILLDPQNPILNARDYVQRKMLPPRVHTQENRVAVDDGDDKPKQMTDQERRWWSSPYRMQASPRSGSSPMERLRL